MRGFLIAAVFLISTAHGLEHEKRQKKQFSLFSVVQFDNLECTPTQSTNTPSGMCYTSTECSDKGGSANGNCANGFGVCCVFSSSTFATTLNQNISYIQNPGFPTAFAPAQATNGVYNVKPCNNNICQFRIDLLRFEVSDKQATGACGTNTLTINAPVARDPPVLCGTLTGQHILVENERSEMDTTFTFAQQGAGSVWNMRVIQIECDSVMRSPVGCLQYYTGAGGTFTSLGRGDNLRMLASPYTICFRREANMCAIDYTATTAGSFDLGVGAAANDNKAINQIGGAQPNDAMLEAFLSIRGADKLFYGGERFSNAAISTVDSIVRANAMPFTVFNSGTVVNNGAVANKGFDLRWNQVPCP